ncbi:hypothetical protein PsYK624_043100 [Phanerochaete sordida]|uniref:Uncharacterized protein n=1 Tax=Phanerochaete sordida TaxID=48140 RepID=A0A9P3LBV5_9APHY|nr:hypothetical protein PsYK624_043100 [Phanerochaete sordida]
MHARAADARGLCGAASGRCCGGPSRNGGLPTGPGPKPRDLERATLFQPVLDAGRSVAFCELRCRQRTQKELQRSHGEDDLPKPSCPSHTFTAM